ncbi:MAG: glycosyltransferase [Cyanobacteria bacterium P01_F01_bin.53]
MSVHKPVISVVIATRNRKDSVVWTIDSILNNAVSGEVSQGAMSSFEILVVDQSTNDCCQQAMQKYAGDSRIRYQHSETVGMARARNLAIAQAKGDLIAITDDDCVVSSNWLWEIQNIFLTYPSVTLLFGNVLAGSHDASAGFIPSYCRQQAKIISNALDKNDVDGLGACMAMRKSLWQELHGFDEMLGVGGLLKSSSEGDLVIHALQKGMQVCEMPSVVVIHHGFRTWEAGSGLIDRYWYGTGAMFGKHLKLYPISTVLTLVLLAVRFVFGTSRVASSLGGNTHKRARLGAFASGFCKGLWLKIDRSTGHFRPPHSEKTRSKTVRKNRSIKPFDQTRNYP